MTEAIPTYTEPGLFGAMRRFQSDPLGFCEGVMNSPHDIAQIHLGPQRAVFVWKPEHVEHVMVKNAKRYSKDTRGYQMLKKVIGLGLVTSEGPFWRRQRRIIQPSFAKRRIATFAEAMTRQTVSMIEGRWTKSEGQSIDFGAEMMRLTLDIVSETMLSLTEESTGNDSVVAKSLPVLLEHVVHRAMHPFSAPEFFPTRRNRDYHKAIAGLNSVVNNIIDERRAQQTEVHDDLLAMLMEAKDEETGEGMNDLQLRDEVMTIYLAGHETTAAALSWTLHLLCQNPTWEKALREEIQTVLQGDLPSVTSFPKLELTQRVILESMRIIPPVWFWSRMATTDDELDGFRISAGTLVFVMPWMTHRDPDTWPEPLSFDPDRFLPERSKTRHRHAYLPFSAGQRKCIGDHFAMMEATLILATMLQRCEFSALEGHEVGLNPTVTIRPKNGMPMNVSFIHS